MKLQIAAALFHKAKLLIMDEATTGLDPVVRSEMLDVFREYIQDDQNSILMSSHITSDLEKIADGVEAMVADREKVKKKYPGLLIERTSLEEIMLFYVNRDKKEWS